MSDGRPVGNGYSHPWARLPNETAKAFEIFSLYCRMRPSERSLNEVYRRYYNRPEINTGSVRLSDWSTKYNWVERTRKYDAHVEKKRIQRNTEERLRMYEEQAQLGRDLSSRGKRIIEANREEETEVSDGIKMVVEGVKIERTSRGEPEKTDKLEITGKMSWIDIMAEMKRKSEKKDD